MVVMAPSRVQVYIEAGRPTDLGVASSRPYAGVR